MHFSRFQRTAVAAGVFASVALTVPAAQLVSRITEQVQDGQTFTLPRNVHPRVQNATDLGVVPASMEIPLITIHLQPSAAQQEELDQLLQQQQDPSSPNYHKWLTPQEFAARFGASSGDIAKIRSWASSQGLSHIKVARTRTFLTMAGTAGAAASAFGTPIHTYQTPDGALHYANATDPTLPHAFQGVVSAVSGLNDFHPKPRAYSTRAATGVSPRFTSSISGNHYVAPGDFATIYDVTPLYNAGITGAGVKIAVPGQTDLNMDQVAAFRSAAGLSSNQPQTMLVGADPGVNADDQLESYLDVEWAGAVAQSATIVYVYAKDVFTAFQDIVDQNLAQVVPLTYGYCEAQFGSTTGLTSLLQTANAEGITVLAASGDLGVADCDEPDPTNPAAQPPSQGSQGLAVDFPASSPYATGIGGTEFDESGGNYWSATNGAGAGSALSYIPEMVWNDTAANSSLSAGGGGASTLFPKPTWQTGTGVPADGHRDVPDISLLASTNHDSILICASDGTVKKNGTLQTQDCTDGFRDVNQNLDAAGGTSVGSPAFAGVVALLVQEYGGGQGNINPHLYQLAATGSNVFHDVTVGNNDVPCKAGTPDCTSAGNYGVYNATLGYDPASGLGSVDASNLVDQWGPSFNLSLNPASLTLSGGQSGAAQLTVSANNGFSGSVGLSCTVSAALTNTTCSVESSLAAPGTATVTVKNANSTMAPPFWRRNLPPAAVGLWAMVMVTALGLAWQRKRMRFATGAFAATSALLLASCGGGSSPATTSTTNSAQPVTVTGSVTITAASGSQSKTVTLSVTEQ